MWKSIYIYCHDVWVQEKLLLELRPLLDETKKRWFFIKYWYGGPHIRLRFEEQSEEFFKKIDTTVSRFFQKNRVEDSILLLHFGKNMKEKKNCLGMEVEPF